MANEFRINEYHELLALHRALLEAKFADDPNDRDIAGSPFVAKFAREVIKALVGHDGDRKGQQGVDRWEKWLALDSSRREWRVALQRARERPEWGKWDEAERRDCARVLLAPFRVSDEQITAFLSAVQED